PRRENFVYRQNIRVAAETVGESFRNLTFQGVPDPRVQVVNTGTVGNDRITPLWTQTKYTDRGTPIRIARWEEAQLIAADVAGGQTAVNTINALHARAGLPSFQSSDPTAIHNQIIEERRRELFLESQRLFDFIRYNLPLVPAPGTQYPPKAGGFYGNQTCVPLPDIERQNNPNLSR